MIDKYDHLLAPLPPRLDRVRNGEEKLRDRISDDRRRAARLATSRETVDGLTLFAAIVGGLALLIAIASRM